MAQNYIKSGERVTVVAGTGGAQSGKFYAVGAMSGISQTSAEEGDEYELDTTGGVYEYGKTGAQVWEQGVKLYYDEDTDTMTTTATDNTYAGVAEQPASVDATIGRIMLLRSF
ncbi:hypothetical protein PsAD2_03023 [Pseudovibrio axinellae]|uniref:DUF2190 family protein n=1 Tax=Pseudovibrio axinellae TaxID=989403 RepID=A0A165XGM3_9HYPH|nr:DUF2190 family protein [Pseudovibrio axinellae]KZL17686.1 hypothetical protein PsAD2_03023 [Pseudovibrio axinellae]SER43637.1 Predicted phage recombinase, RecA/RadA family [Pseudovibrio axinellae]